MVTGGSSGLGAETSQLFIDEGANVFIADLEERSILQRLGQNAHFHKCDVSSPQDCESTIAACVKHFGRVDILFHNAGILTKHDTVATHDIATFQRVLEVNLTSLFYLGREVIPQMQSQGGGSIVVTGSTAGLLADFGTCSYNASKAGVVNLARVMALDHAHEGIRVNIVCPGLMNTPMTTLLTQQPDADKAVRDRIPLGRGAEPVEVAKAVLFLASSDASYITGQSKSLLSNFTRRRFTEYNPALIVDGGLMAQTGFPNFPKLLGTVVCVPSKTSL